MRELSLATSEGILDVLLSELQGETSCCLLNPIFVLFPVYCVQRQPNDSQFKKTKVQNKLYDKLYLQLDQRALKEQNELGFSAANHLQKHCKDNAKIKYLC